MFWLFLLPLTTARIATLPELLGLRNDSMLTAEDLTITFPRATFRQGVFNFTEAIVNAKTFNLTDPTGSSEASIRHLSHPTLRASLNTSVDPCDDFYSFVCDGWIANNPIKQEDYTVSQTQQLTDRVQEQLKSLFSDRQRFEATRERTLMFTLYDKCMNTQEREHLRSMELFRTLRGMRLAGYRFITDWMIDFFPQTLFYDVAVAPNELNSTINELQVFPASTFMIPQSYYDPAYQVELDALKRYLFTILQQVFSDDHNRELFSGSVMEINRRINSFITVDKAMAKILLDFEGDTSNSVVKLRQLHKLLPSVNWRRYLTSILPRKVLRRYDLFSEDIRLQGYNAALEVEKMLRRFDDQTFADYLEWKVILAHVDFMDKRFKKVSETYNTEVYGVKENKTEWKTCVGLAVQTFGDVASALYIEENFDKAIIPEVSSMVARIRSAFLEMLDENEWMDGETKEKARTKANAIMEFIAFSDDIFNQTAIRIRYADLDFHPRMTFMEMSQTIAKWGYRYGFLKLLEPNNRKNFEFNSAEVNAFYEPTQNQIALLAGILQSPFFDAAMPRVINYGSLGVVTGHEITHGFDNTGALYDVNGNKANWWDEATFDSFERQKQCIVEQYGNITVPDINIPIDGKRTEPENIADNGGMRAAIHATRQLLLNPLERAFVFDGLEKYSPMQLFFMNYAFTWCGQSRPATVRSQLATDPHSPPEYRVNAVLANQKEFAETFQCKAGSAMVNPNPCKVW